MLFELLVAIFEVFWSKSRVLGQIGRSGKVLGFISSNFGPNPTAGRPPKGNNRGTINIMIIPAKLIQGFELFQSHPVDIQLEALGLKKKQELQR